MTKQEKLNQIQALQDQIYDLYRADFNGNAENPAAVLAGVLAWEAVRLFWYTVAGDQVGVKEKTGYVREALDRFRHHLRNQPKRGAKP